MTDTTTQVVRDYTCRWIQRQNGSRCYWHEQTRMGVLVVAELERVAISPLSWHRNRKMAEQKLAVLKKAQYRCERCGETQCLTIDHVTPLSQKYGHGTNWRSTLSKWREGDMQVLCTWCHRDKDGWDLYGNTLQAA